MAGELSAPRATLARRIVRGDRWRTALGVALVTAAAALVLVAHRSAQEPPQQRWLVLTEEVAAGTALERSHLGAAAIELPSGVDAIALERADELVGRTAAASLAPGRLLTEADLLAAGRFGPSGSGVEVSVTLDAGRVPAGGLGAGTVVDVLATDPDGDGTRRLATGVAVVEAEVSDDGAIGTAGGIRVRLAVADDQVAIELVDAAVREQLTVVVPAPGPRREAP